MLHVFNGFVKPAVSPVWVPVLGTVSALPGIIIGVSPFWAWLCAIPQWFISPIADLVLGSSD
jgi:hypothetical protein